MTLQTPSLLWWLVPLFGAILVLYLLKMRRRDVRVPATFLWPSLTADVRANAPFQRLRPSVLLFLQLLIAALLVFGLANPLRKAHGLHGRATVVVLDAGASMAATDVSPTRFEEARRRVAGIVETMNSGDLLALVEAGPTTRVVFPLSGDRPRMLAALKNLQPTDAPNAIGEALRLAAALIVQRPEGRIVVLSDGTFPPVQDFSPGKAEVVFEQIGTGTRNLAITAMDAADAPNGAMQLYVGIRNYEAAPREATLTVLLDGVAADARKITVGARQRFGHTLDIPASARKAEARLDAQGDILPADNRAALFLHGAGAVRTLLVTPGNLFLERALALDPTVRLDKAAALPEHERASSSAESRYDLVIFDGTPVEAVKATSVLSFGGASPEVGVDDLGPVAWPRVASGRAEHPTLRYVDLEGTLIEKGTKVRARAGARTLVSGSEGPLIVASERGARRALYVAFKSLDSDWPLRVSFPIFVGNAVRWLTGEGRAAGEGGGMNVRAGQVFTVAAPGGAATLTLRGPDGLKAALDAGTGLVTVREAVRVGDYTLTGPKASTDILANLLDEEESDVVPRATLDLAGKSVAATGDVIVLADTWRPLLLLALLVLSIEWWVFVKRS